MPFMGGQICHTWSACQILVFSVGNNNYHFMGVDLPHLVCKILLLSVGIYNWCLQQGYICHTWSAKYQFSVQKCIITISVGQICHTWSACQILVFSVGINIYHFMGVDLPHLVCQILVLSVGIYNCCLQQGYICHTWSAKYQFSVYQSIIPLYGWVDLPHLACLPNITSHSRNL